MATDGPKFSKLMVGGAKIEATTGTAETIAAADCAMYIENAEWTLDQKTLERQQPNSLGQAASAAGADTASVKFRIRVGNGASGLPLWATVFLPACDFSLSGSTFTKARTLDTITFADWRDGFKRVLYGARGNGKLLGTNGEPQFIEFDFKGCYTREATDTAPSPITYPTATFPKISGTTLTIGGYTPRVSKVNIDFGNDVILREDVVAASSYHGAAITGWKPMIELDPELVVLATKDFSALRDSATEAAFSFVVGSVATNIFTWGAPSAQVQKSPIGDREGMMINSLMLQCNGTAPLTLAFS